MCIFLWYFYFALTYRTYQQGLAREIWDDSFFYYLICILQFVQLDIWQIFLTERLTYDWYCRKNILYQAYYKLIVYA